jgi:hypothetical protein
VKSEEFIREVDEELRRDQFAKLWRQYGTLVVVFAVLVIAGTAGKVGWDHWRQSERAAEALRFAAADTTLAADRHAEAAAQFAALAGDGKTGFALLARLKEAQAKLALKDEAGAVAALDSVADAKPNDPLLRDLGVLLAAERQLDTADPAELTKVLEPLTTSEAPWRNPARELLALVAIRAGDLDKARTLMQALSVEVGVPQSQQRRAAELLQAIGGAAPPAGS